jgi:hypothetical protein
LDECCFGEQSKDIAGQVVSEVQSRLPQDKPMIPQQQGEGEHLQQQQGGGRKHRNRGKKHKSQEGEQSQSLGETTEAIKEKGQEALQQGKQMAEQVAGDVQDKLQKNLQSPQQQQGGGRKHRNRGRKSKSQEGDQTNLSTEDIGQKASQMIDKVNIPDSSEVLYCISC